MADHIFHESHQLFLRAVLTAAAGVAVGVAAVLMGMRMLVFVVVRVGMRMGMGRAVRMGMRMAVDRLVMVKMHGASSSFVFSRCIISVPLDFVKRAEARLSDFPKTFSAISRF